MLLNNDNYFSMEAGKEYLSVSQFKAFQSCEFSAHAQFVTGEYKRPITDALLVGSYVDAYFAGTFDEWKDKHPEILTKSLKLRAPFINAGGMIARIEQDPLFLSTMQGLKQQILIADINGVKWKMLPDFINVEDSICYDLKTTKDFKPEWNKTFTKKVPFYEAWNYFLQLAIYQIALMQKYDKDFDMVISAVTKEPVPDINIIEFTSDDCLDRFEKEIENVKEYQQFIIKIKAGDIPVNELMRCEACNYCKQTKKLDSFDMAIVL